MAVEIKWTVLKGYSIDARLKADGLSFDAFDIVRKTFQDNGAMRLRKKIIGRLGAELRNEYAEENDGAEINDIKEGCYCICLGGNFLLRYTQDFSSRVLYIGSGAVYSRVKNHLSGKLFDFAQSLPGVPLRFYFTNLGNMNIERKAFEQRLLSRFQEISGGELPLLNKNKAKSVPDKSDLGAGWDKPLQKDKGKKAVGWLVEPTNADHWKGAL